MDIQTLGIITLLGSFAVMIFLRFPIAYAVGLSSVFCLLVQDKSLMDVCRLMVKGISSFSLMAVPFFITMGVLMGSGGISEKLIALANSCVGWMRGGLAQVNVVASYFFGGNIVAVHLFVAKTQIQISLFTIKKKHAVACRPSVSTSHLCLITDRGYRFGLQ